MSNPDEIDYLLSLLTIHRTTLEQSLLLAAIYGGIEFAPTATAHIIRNARAEIQRIKDVLREKGIVVEDHPDDQDPATVTGTRPPRIYHNLPAPTYSQFVMRALPFADVLDGLQQRSAVVLIVGLGGNGKTSLAREVAARCLQNGEDAPHFDTVVWISDKDGPDTTNLSMVLDEIARTLDYPGLTQFAHNEKLYKVGQLLKNHTVLIVIDNFETITDGTLLTWLLRLPEPSKALITSREKHRGLWSSWLVELRGMSEAEAQTLIDQRLRMLQLDKLARNPAEFEPLIAVTGGNPKAIELALGLVKHGHWPLQQVVDDLHAARGELFDDLFTRAWALLDKAAQQVLLSMAFFPADAGVEALSITASVQGFAFDRAKERLIDLALLDIQLLDLVNPQRYTLHPLVRAFAGAKLARRLVFEAKAHKRWLGWCANQAAQVGYCWKETKKLETLDPEQETIYAALEWAADHAHNVEALTIANGVSYYFFVRCIWDKKENVEMIRAQAAHVLNESVDEAEALACYIQMLSRQGISAEEEKRHGFNQNLSRLEELLQSVQLPEETMDTCKTAIALSHMADGDFQTAQNLLDERIRPSKSPETPEYNIVLRWRGILLYMQGKLPAARQALEEALYHAEQLHHDRSCQLIRIRIAAVDLDEGNLKQAEATLLQCRMHVLQYQDYFHIAEIQRLFAHLHMRRGNHDAARSTLAEAIDLFARLGMRRELNEAHKALANLDIQE